MSNKVNAPVISAREITKSKKLGAGQFGEVWQGKCRGADVAIKYLKHFDSSMKDDFVAEVEIMAQVVHPHIVLLLGACTDERPWCMVTELMSKGDLNYILHEYEGELPLNRKLQFAIDISSGMAWLTGKEVKILHRDLKPGNVLVDQNWTCKICDFGLSLLEAKGMVRGDAAGGGSPLWMSPEALLEEFPLTEKNDVYAFGLVFWEILTQKALFTEYTDLDVFTDHIANKGIRPSLEGVPDDIVPIVVQCWDKKQEVRPAFKDLISILKKLRVDINVPSSLCPQAGTFWEKAVPTGRDTTTFTAFFNALFDFVRPRCDREIASKCISQLLWGAHDHSGDHEISLDIFSKLLKWFGPLKAREHDTFLDILCETMKQPWFFGLLSKDEAEDKLLPYRAPGTFLVRLNPGTNTPIETCPYTISRVANDKSFTHTRIQPSKAGGYFVKIEETSKGQNLLGLISVMVQKTPEFQTCLGHPYATIFEARDGGGGYTLPDEESSGEEKVEKATKTSSVAPPKPSTKPPKKGTGEGREKKGSSTSASKKKGEKTGTGKTRK